MSLQLSIAHASAIGPRTENQDALRVVTPVAELAASKGYLCAMADGVSQCADGGLAARSTLQALALDYYATPQTWGVAQALERLLLAQNRWLQANGGGQPLLTTLSALVFRGQRFTLAHVGDCRVYRWLDGELQRISEDHVWEQPGMHHVLKRALGLDQHLVLDFLDGELREGECFLLLSDGVWATLGDHSIRAILREQTDLDLAVNTLVNAAHLAASQDNASALLVRIDKLGAATLGDALVQLQQWPLPPVLKAGQHFEGWQVESVLAHSRQSLLYRVRDAQQQPWLLKTLPLNREDDNGAGQALLSEEWFLRRVAGRAFPEVHAASGRQHLYYVMREYPGHTLAALFQHQGPLPRRSGSPSPNDCCGRWACCIDGRSCTGTSSRKTCYWVTTANCASWISAWPIARGSLKTAPTNCPARRVLSPRRRSVANILRRNRIYTASASRSITC